MLRLHRITDPNEFRLDTVTGQVILPGDFYYVDDEDGLVVNAKTYYNLKFKKKKNEWPYTAQLNEAKSQKEYNQQLKQAEHDLLKQTVLTRKVWGKDSQNNDLDGAS